MSVNFRKVNTKTQYLFKVKLVGKLNYRNRECGFASSIGMLTLLISFNRVLASRGELRTQTPDADKFVIIVMLLSYYIGRKKGNIINCVKYIPS